MQESNEHANVLEAHPTSQWCWCHFLLQ